MIHMKNLVGWSLLVTFCGGAGCSSSSTGTTACIVDADCSGGMVCSNGTCTEQIFHQPNFGVGGAPTANICDLSCRRLDNCGLCMMTQESCLSIPDCVAHCQSTNNQATALCIFSLNSCSKDALSACLSGTAGATSVGGATSIGGGGAGGLTPAGGTRSTGGNVATAVGGTTSAGGSVYTGGTASTGGSVGRSSTGGFAPTGGSRNQTGGAGGVSVMGGRPNPTGGTSSATGGVPTATGGQGTAGTGNPCLGNTCSGHGTCSAGICSCSTGYAGTNCGSCASGYGVYPTCTLCNCAPGSQACNGTSALNTCDDGCHFASTSCASVCLADGHINYSSGCSYDPKVAKDTCFCPDKSTDAIQAWSFKDLCSDGLAPTVQLYDMTSGSVSGSWPSQFLSSYSQLFTQTIECQTGDKICWGAWQSNLYWGCGQNCAAGCTNCCWTCGSALTVNEQDLTCG